MSDKMIKGSFEDLVHMLFENINRTKINFAEFKEFIDNAISFNDNGIVTEDKNLLIDVPEELISYCMNNNDVDIDITQLKKFMKNSKHYFNMKNIKDGSLFLTVFNFRDDIEVKEFILKLFDVNEEDLQKEIEYFKLKQGDKNGFYYYDKVNNKHICGVNLNFNHIYETIYHELSHVIQEICNIRITPSTEINRDFIFNKLEKMKKDLQIDDNYISYLFDRHEFCTHLDDLILSLSKTYSQFYKDKSLFDFYYYIVLTSIQKIASDKFLTCDFIKKYREANDNDLQSIVMFYVSYYLNLKYYKIKQTVWKSLKKKMMR